MFLILSIKLNAVGRVICSGFMLPGSLDKFKQMLSPQVQPNVNNPSVLNPSFFLINFSHYVKTSFWKSVMTKVYLLWIFIGCRIEIGCKNLTPTAVGFMLSTVHVWNSFQWQANSIARTFPFFIFLYILPRILLIELNYDFVHPIRVNINWRNVI